MIERIFEKNFFTDILLEMGKNFSFYSRSKININEYGEYIPSFEKYQIYGVLQSSTDNKEKLEGVTQVQHKYVFYCDSKYRIYIDDIIENSEEMLLVTGVKEYDSHGVRKIECESIGLSERRDLTEFLQYIKGEKTK